MSSETPPPAGITGNPAPGSPGEFPGNPPPPDALVTEAGSPAALTSTPGPAQPEVGPEGGDLSVATPEVREAYRWLREVYQGDRVPQLTPRAVVSGMLIGTVMSVSNLYVGLKTGWGLGVTVTACIIAFAVFKTLEAIVPAYRRNPFSILENNTMSSAASAAGYISTASLASSIPALYLSTGTQLIWWQMMAWIAAVATLGVFMAVPLKRQMINIDQLPFPTGIATAETLRAMHSSGAEALSKARSLIFSALAGALLALWRDAWGPFALWLGRILRRDELGKALAAWAFPDNFPLFPGGGTLMERYTLGFEGSLIMVAAGAIMGIRVGVSLLVGAVFFYGVLGPLLLDRGLIAGPGYKNIVSWTLWPATALLVTSGLLSFALRWRTVVRAFAGLADLLGKRKKGDDPLAHVEVPGSWFVAGVVVSGAACVFLGHYIFGIRWWMGVIAVLATFALSIVAARATGETDITPIGAMGKITQLIFGVLAPANMTTNLMTAAITAGGASHSADLLTDVKSGYLLGGNPRKQTIAQLFGVLAGVLVCVPVYTIVTRPDPTQAPQVAAAGEKEEGEAKAGEEEAGARKEGGVQEKLGSPEMPAPSAQVWASVAKLLAKGLDALPRGALLGMLAGGVLGVVLTLAEELLAERYRKWLPSPTGLGIAGVIPAFNSVSMFVGALLAWLLTKYNKDTGERYVIPVSSGLIAGESLMGVAIILALQGPALVQALKQALWGG